MKADELPWYRFSLVTLTLLFVILLIHTCRLQRRSSPADFNPLTMPTLTGTGGVGVPNSAQLVRAKMLRRPAVSSTLQMQHRRRPTHSRLLPRSRRRFDPLEGKLDGQGHLVIWRPTRYMNRNKRSEGQIGERKKYSPPDLRPFANVPPKYRKTIQELEIEKDENALKSAKGGQAAVNIVSNVLRKVDRHRLMQKKLGLPAKPNEKKLTFKNCHPTEKKEHLVKVAAMRTFEKLFDEIIRHEIKLRTCPKLVPRQQAFLKWLQKGNPFYENEPPSSDTFLFTNNKMNSKNILKKIKKFREKCQHAMPQNEEYHQLQKRLETLEKMLNQYESLSLEEKKQVEGIRWQVVQELNEAMMRMEQLKKSNRLTNFKDIPNPNVKKKEKNKTRHHLDTQLAEENNTNQTNSTSPETTIETNKENKGAVRQRRSQHYPNDHKPKGWRQSNQKQQPRNSFNHRSKTTNLDNLKPFHQNLQPSTRKRLVRLENLSKQKPWTRNYANLLVLFLKKAEREAKEDARKFMKWISPNYRRLAKAIYRKKRRSRRRKRRELMKNKVRKKQQKGNENLKSEHQKDGGKIKTDSKKQT